MMDENFGTILVDVWELGLDHLSLELVPFHISSRPQFLPLEGTVQRK